MITKEKAVEIVLSLQKQHFKCLCTDDIEKLDGTAYVKPEYDNCWFVIVSQKQYVQKTGGTSEVFVMKKVTGKIIDKFVIHYE